MRKVRVVSKKDEMEFKQNAQRLRYPPGLIVQVRAAYREVEVGLAKRIYPFHYERQVKLYYRIKSELRV